VIALFFAVSTAVMLVVVAYRLLEDL